MKDALDALHDRLAPAEEICFTWLTRVFVAATLAGSGWIDDAPALDIAAMLVAIYVAVRVATQFGRLADGRAPPAPSACGRCSRSARSWCSACRSSSSSRSWSSWPSRPSAEAQRDGSTDERLPARRRHHRRHTPRNAWTEAWSMSGGGTTRRRGSGTCVTGRSTRTSSRWHSDGVATTLVALRSAAHAAGVRGLPGLGHRLE